MGAHLRAELASKNPLVNIPDPRHREGPYTLLVQDRMLQRNRITSAIFCSNLPPTVTISIFWRYANGDWRLPNRVYDHPTIRYVVHWSGAEIVTLVLCCLSWR